MVKLALGFVSGVWLLQQQSMLPSLYWVFLLFPLSLFVYVTAKLHSRLRDAVAALLYYVSLFFLAFAVGFLWALVFAQLRLSDALPTAWERQTIQIEGVVATMPQQHESGMRFEFNVEKVLTPNAIVPSHISISEYTQQLYSNGLDAQHIQIANPNHYRAGERWRLSVRLKRPHGTFNPHGFDFEAWALERNIRATGYIRKDEQNKKLRDFVWRPSYVVESLRERIRARMQTVLAAKPYAGVLKALAIGDDDGILVDDWQIFLRTGVTHLISISGLHITMLSGMMYALVYALWRRYERLTLILPARKAATIVGVLVALAYSLVAGFSVPTQRTLYMLTVFAIALWGRRHIAIGQVLSCALVFVVLLDPWAVLSAGFWLSFGAVAAISYVLAARVKRSHWFREAIQTQWAVTIGLLPLLIVMFGQVSLISPVANAFAIPVISLIVVPFTLLGALFPLDWPLALAHSVMNVCMQCLTWLSHLTLATWQQQAPPSWAFITAMLGVLWMMLPRGFPNRFLGLAGLLPMLLIKPIAPDLGEMRVAVLDVGQGLAVVIQTHRHQLLYDTGPRYSAQTDAGAKVILPYLRGEGLLSIDALIVSHNDLDHTGGMQTVLEQFPVKWLLSSFAIDSAVGASHQYVKCQAGQKWEWDGVRFDVLHPVLDSYDNSSVTDNNRSCVLRASSQSGSILITGDIEKQAERELLQSYAEQLKSDVLIAPHHGSKTSSTQAFVEAVEPSAVIFTMGYLNKFNHPKHTVVERYKALGSKVYRSDKDGAVLLSFNRSVNHMPSIQLTTWRKDARRYWHD